MRAWRTTTKGVDLSTLRLLSLGAWHYRFSVIAGLVLAIRTGFPCRFLDLQDKPEDDGVERGHCDKRLNLGVIAGLIPAIHLAANGVPSVFGTASLHIPPEKRRKKRRV